MVASRTNSSDNIWQTPSLHHADVSSRNCPGCTDKKHDRTESTNSKLKQASYSGFNSGLSYAAIFRGSHSGLKSRTSKAVDALTETAPHDAHLRLLGTVILGPT